MYFTYLHRSRKAQYTLQTNPLSSPALMYFNSSMEKVAFSTYSPPFFPMIFTPKPFSLITNSKSSAISKQTLFLTLDQQASKHKRALKNNFQWIIIYTYESEFPAFLHVLPYKEVAFLFGSMTRNRRHF